jgi:hypothetical protein
MKLLLKSFVCLMMLVQAMAVTSHAQELQVVAVPDALPADQHMIFEEKRAGLLKEWDTLIQKRAAYVSEFKGTKADDVPRVAAAAQRRAELGAEAERIAGEADDFMQAVTIAVHIASLTTQIKGTEAQLQALGFKQRAEDYEQIKGMSGEAMAQLKARLFFRLQDLVQQKPEEAMQEHFLAAVKNLRPGQIRNMHTSLKKAGLADLVFLKRLRYFQPNKPNAELVADAEALISFLRREKGLAGFFEDLDPDATDTRQEAALTLLSLVMDHPYFDELRAVVSGDYDVSEAWFYVAVLDMNDTDLAAVTDDKLSNQKRLLTQMKDLIEERNMLRTEMEKLQTPESE